jgi:hypothetical protein
LQYLNNHLSHRLGGFTSKDKLNLILDSKSPSAISGVFVPKENYSIFLNTSSPTKKLNYSGVIVTRVLTRSGIGYEVKGYSQTQPFFYYYPWVQSGNDINVGGISESFTNIDEYSSFKTHGLKEKVEKIEEFKKCCLNCKQTDFLINDCEKFDLNIGECISFDGSKTYHGVLPVTNGIRYALNIWMTDTDFKYKLLKNNKTII